MLNVLKESIYLQNVFLSFYNYKLKKTNCSSKPVVFWIEPTNACNLKCPMCPSSYSDLKKGFMDMNLFKKIINEISRFTLSNKLLQRGEPLLHPNVVEMVEYMTRKSLWTEIDTNGTLLTKELAEGLIRAGLKYISFSFDGYDKETYENVRKGANFEKTIENIKKFLEIRERLNKKDIYVRIKSLYQSDDRFCEDKKKKFIELFRGFDIDEFSITPVWNWGNDKVAENAEIFDIKEIYKIRKEDLQSNKFHPCQRLWTTMSIMWDGKVVPCCSFFENDVILGDVNKETILEIWNGDKMREMREMNILKNIENIPQCNTCSIYFTKTFFGIPLYFYGPQDFLKRVIGYKNYRKIYNFLVNYVKSS